MLVLSFIEVINMVVMTFPAAKLGALLIRQVSKPIANVIAKKAKQHPLFSRLICMPPAQFYHWCEVRVKMYTMNLTSPTQVTPLNETMAIELGASILSEAIIFTIAATLLLAEYSRQVRKEEAKEDARRDELNHIQYSLEELFYHAEQQERGLNKIMIKIGELEEKIDNIENYRDQKGTPGHKEEDQIYYLSDMFGI